MEQLILKTIKEHKMILQGDNVIVALSGGADSVALFHFLLAHAQLLGISKIYAAHFEHGIRENDSQLDADYVAKLCVGCGVELLLEHGNMNTKTRPKGQGVEAWARHLRYEFFERAAKEYNAKIATAHTLNDNAETVLFNAARGSGPKGLAGIPPVRGCYIRPLINVNRTSIENYCNTHKLHFVRDYTNEDVSYSRNRIRHEVLPGLEKAHEGATLSLGRMAADMREIDSWIEQEAQVLLQKSQQKSIKQHISGYLAEKLLAAPAPVYKKALAMLAGRSVDRAAIDRLIGVLKGEIISTQLPGKKRAMLYKACLIIENDVYPKDNLAQDYFIPLQIGSINLENGYEFEVFITDSNNFCKKTSSSDKKGLPFVADYDKIYLHGVYSGTPRCISTQGENSGYTSAEGGDMQIDVGVLVFRPRKTGDMISPRNRKVTKTLKKWMSEQAIPQNMRDCMPVLAHENKVMWVWGYGFCEGFTPDETTQRYLVITAKGNDYNG